MTPFDRLDAIAAPMPLANVDTDKILAGRFLKTIAREGLGAVLFSSLREDPGFILNRTPWNKASILIALDNFGCGSSREHAPWALLDFGIRCIIAPTIADIFYTNCCKNGILPIMLPRTDISRLMELASEAATARMSVDLEAQTILTTDGVVLGFAIDPKRKLDLLAGADEITQTTLLSDAISAFEAEAGRRRPWLKPPSFTPSFFDGIG